MNKNHTDLIEHIALKQVVTSLVSPPESTLNEFLSLFTMRCLHKGAFFQRSGDKADELCFVNSGLLRMFYTTQAGKEMNKSFVLENNFAGAYSAWLSRAFARFNIQALEETSLLVAPLDQISLMFDKHQCWERLGRIMAEQLFVRKEEREAEFLLDDAETRYEAFQQRYGELEGRIPQYHVASYLGITPVALSRLRNR